MEFNVNVNVKLSLDNELGRILKGVLLPSIVDAISNATAKPAEVQAPDPVNWDTEAPAIVEKPDVTNIGPTEFDPKDPSPIQTVTDVSDLPFDNEPEEKPLPVVAIWTEEHARRARKMKMDFIENSVDPEIKENVHKQMVKLTKIYLQAAAYKHDRNEMGDAITKDGLPVKKLNELDSDETLRFMYLCDAMHYDVEEGKVLPFEGLADLLSSCKKWNEVERDFVKTYTDK